MTIEEFQNLSLESQEEFLNSGGNIDVEKEASILSATITQITKDAQPVVVCSSKDSNSDATQHQSISQSNLVIEQEDNDSPLVVANEKEQSVSTEEGFPSVLPSQQTAPSLNRVAPGSGCQLESKGDCSVVVAQISAKEDFRTSSEVHEEKAGSIPAVVSKDLSFINGFDIKDPVELLHLLDEDIIEGRHHLSQKQLQILTDFANERWSSSDPYQGVVNACNGSGKDRFLIAASAVWLCMRFIRTSCIVTSSSGQQLDKQTCRYITYLCNRANCVFGIKIWITNYRNYKLDFGEGKISAILCFATDEPEKAEGYHPIADQARMAIFTSEDKSIPDVINTALNRCSGYTHRLHVSTPGQPMGHFFDYWSTAIDRDSTSIDKVEVMEWIQYNITYKECPWISEAYYRKTVNDTPGGENSPVIKSQFWAKFGTTDEMVVVASRYVITASKTKIDWIIEEHNQAGLDLSDGGDECVLAPRNGNKLLKLICFRFDNTEDTVKYLDEQFEENELTHPDSHINADCGGLGKPILDRLKRMGWSNIRYRDNRGKTNRPQTYKNWGAQSWFHFGKLLEEGQLILLRDEKLIKQISTRYYKIIDGAVHQLLSKIESRARGYPSPDRADSAVLSFCEYKSTFSSYERKEDKPPFEKPKEKPIVNPLTLNALAKGNEPYQYSRKFRINGGQKDFTDLNEEISDYNKARKLINV